MRAIATFLFKDFDLRQRSLSHQILVAFAGGAAAFVDGPDDQALAAALGPKQAGWNSLRYSGAWRYNCLNRSQ